MAIMECVLRVSELGPHQQMQFSIILRICLLVEFYPSAGDTVDVLKSQREGNHKREKKNTTSCTAQRAKTWMSNTGVLEAYQNPFIHYLLNFHYFTGYISIADFTELFYNLLPSFFIFFFFIFSEGRGFPSSHTFSFLCYLISSLFI